MARAIGPLTTTSGPENHVVATKPCTLNVVGAGRLERRQHDRQVLRETAGHHRVDRDLLDRALDEVGRNDRDDVGRIAGGARAHAGDPLGGRRHEGEPVAPTARVHRLALVLGVAELDRAGLQLRGDQGNEAGVDDFGIVRSRPASGTPVGETDAEIVDAGELLPPAALPADEPVDLVPVLHANQRRHGVDVERERNVEPGVVVRADAVGKRGIVLGVDRELLAELREDGRDELARRARPLHDCDEAVRNHATLSVSCVPGGSRWLV